MPVMPFHHQLGTAILSIGARRSRSAVCCSQGISKPTGSTAYPAIAVLFPNCTMIFATIYQSAAEPESFPILTKDWR